MCMCRVTAFYGYDQKFRSFANHYWHWSILVGGYVIIPYELNIVIVCVSAKYSKRTILLFTH